MKKRSKLILLCAGVVLCILLMLVFTWKRERDDNLKENKPQETSVETSIETSVQAEADMYEKGYNLPLSKEKKEKAAAECIAAMQYIQEIYANAEKVDSFKGVISQETEDKMLQKLAELGWPAVPASFHFDLQNPQKIEQFLQSAGEAEVTLYELHSDGSIGRRVFSFDGEDMYLLYTGTEWGDGNEPLIARTSFTRIKKWEYTRKGWFSYELCVPEPPEVSEVMNGNAMIRIKPLNEEFRKLNNQFLMPIGYQGNNLLCSDWNSEHLEDLDYNGLYEYLYAIKYQKGIEPSMYLDGIPMEEFESLMMEFLPVTAEQLRQYAVYEEEKGSYSFKRLGVGTFAPGALGTSVPEITNVEKNDDGTITLTTDAVCEPIGKDQLFTHKVIVRLLDHGGIMYLSNQIERDGTEQLPGYQYRFGSHKTSS